jgi:Cu2+-containing amine oxidase
MWARSILGLVLLGGPLTLGLAFSSHPQPAAPDVTAGPPNYHHIVWPAKNPVWEFTWLAPDASSGAGHGRSGLELRGVRYKGHTVLYQAHLPVLNVLYEKPHYPGCGPSYRDWQDELSPFEANNVLAPGYAEPTVPPKMVYDHPGTQGPGKFSGVAVQKLPDRLIMSTQMEAGWYRYSMEWTFHLNGVIEPRYGFTAVKNPCTSKPHTHHAYWRFDFDIDGFPDDVIEEYNPKTKQWTAFKTETSRRRDATARMWRVRDLKTNRGYEIIPGAEDGHADDFAVADLWFLRYHPNETNDGGVPLGGSIEADQVHVSKYLNKEDIHGQDVVVWYRAGHYHAPPVTRIKVGPTLKPFGKW